MGIDRIEQLEDRVKVHISFSNHSPIPDENTTSEILYSDIPSLPIAPQVPKGRYDSKFWAERVFIPKVNQTIEYHFHEWQETVAATMQGLEGGPYLVVPSNPDKNSKSSL